MLASHTNTIIEKWVNIGAVFWATVYPRFQSYHDNLFWSSEPYLLPECSKAEQKTSSLVSLPLRIWHQTDPPSGIKDGPIWCAVLMTGPDPWHGSQQWKHDIVTRWSIFEPPWHHPPGMSSKFRTGQQFLEGVLSSWSSLWFAWWLEVRTGQWLKHLVL